MKILILTSSPRSLSLSNKDVKLDLEPLLLSLSLCRLPVLLASAHCAKGTPNTRPPPDSANQNKKGHINAKNLGPQKYYLTERMSIESRCSNRHVTIIYDRAKISFAKTTIFINESQVLCDSIDRI